MKQVLLLGLFLQFCLSKLSPTLRLGIYSDLVQLNADSTQFVLPPLPYPYNALEPYIDAETMKLHHSKHHQAYTDKLNAAIVRAREIEKKLNNPDEPILSTIGDLLSNLELVPEEIRDAVRNHGGGYLNHAFFWKSMTTFGSSGQPSSLLLSALENKFESNDGFRSAFNAKAMGLFGSGWVWLTFNNKNGQLQLDSSTNQDTPIMDDNIPILGLDVWEHAYYLKYQNKRVDYIIAWWNVIDWGFVSHQYEMAVERFFADKDEL